jgi:hypothetical protein
MRPAVGGAAPRREVSQPALPGGKRSAAREAGAPNQLGAHAVPGSSAGIRPDRGLLFGRGMSARARALCSIPGVAAVTFAALSLAAIHVGYALGLLLAIAAIVAIGRRWCAPSHPPAARRRLAPDTRAAFGATLAACGCPRCGGPVRWVSVFRTWWCARCGRLRDDTIGDREGMVVSPASAARSA